MPGRDPWAPGEILGNSCGSLGMPVGTPNAHKGTQEEILDACLPPCPPHWGTSWGNLDQQFAWGRIHPLQKHLGCPLGQARFIPGPPKINLEGP